MKRILLFWIFCSALFGLHLKAQVTLPPSDELYCIHFDRQGLLWMGTSEGIRSYDGYAVKEGFAGIVHFCPQLSSDVRSLTTDNDDNLWAGTNDGLVRISLATHQVHLYRFPKQSQKIIYRLFLSSDGTLYVGTDDGFSIYHKEKDEFEHFNVDRTKAVMPDGHTDKYTGWGVKDFVETPDGDILIGTWSQGLWRYSPKKKQIRAYGQVNWMNSAFTLCIDRQQRLWIGTQAYGVQRIDRLDDYKLETLQFVNPETANPAPHRVVYDLIELENGKIYVCTGDTIATQMGPDGAMWIATRFGGIQRQKNNQTLFRWFDSGSVQSLFTDNGRQFYFGNGSHGLAWIDTETEEVRLGNQVPGFGWLPTDGFSPKRITSMIRRENGELWMAAGDNGILVSREDGSGALLYANSRELPFVRDNVTALCESRRDGTLWIGQRQGVSYLKKDGTGQHLEVKQGDIDLTGYFMVNHLTEDHEGCIWVASAGSGIVKIDPTHGGMQYQHYPTPCPNITACFEDSRHRLWAICAQGMLLYSAEKDCFENMSQSLHLSKKILAINEDRYGALWLATDHSLVRIDTDDSSMSFTEEDGLVGTTFFPNATFRHDNTLYFGTAEGMVAFQPSESYKDRTGTRPTLVVTDLFIDGSSVLTLDSLTAARISEVSPSMTRHISIPASVKKFGIEFALLNYSNPSETRYAYRLDGYDDWQYVDATDHRAVFNRVPPGTYQFQLRAIDSRGEWYELPYTIEVHVLTPWYQTWWAYLIYFCLLALLARFIWKYMQMQREMKASRRFSTILQSAQIQTASDTTENETGQENGAGQRNAEFVARATQLVRDHLDDSDYNRDSMAADLGMSVSSLYSRLRETTDLSIQTFIQTIRLNAAADILRHEPDIRISELAYRVGFNTPKYFSQCFKKEFGVLPGDYIKAE